MEETRLAVNGTLMRGLPLNNNLLRVGAKFLREEKTSPNYRLWSINDQYPAMIRDTEKGAAINLEIWKISESGVLSILSVEPAGLCIGKVELASGLVVLGVLGEPYIIQDQTEITSFGGWREYLIAKGNSAG
ncbi:MAG: allophanate hydrolase-related protein [Anaerolineaceae bacterium]